jgi:methylated-DNA-[protein]-cysteine S-methyltransferase
MAKRTSLRAGLIATPCGPMIAVVTEDGALVRLEFVDRDGAPTPSTASSWRGPTIIRDDAAVAHVARQLDEYFAGARRTFDLKLAPQGNAFLQETWRILRVVPYGTTVCYGELARRLTRPTSARAIGRANAMNPIAIVVPCHRVIGADGSLVGYGGGLDRKAALLALEGALPASRQGVLPLETRQPAEPSD